MPVDTYDPVYASMQLSYTVSLKHTEILEISSHPMAEGHDLRSINTSHVTALIPKPAP